MAADGDLWTVYKLQSWNRQRCPKCVIQIDQSGWRVGHYRVQIVGFTALPWWVGPSWGRSLLLFPSLWLSYCCFNFRRAGPRLRDGFPARLSEIPQNGLLSSFFTSWFLMHKIDFEQVIFWLIWSDKLCGKWTILIWLCRWSIFYSPSLRFSFLFFFLFSIFEVFLCGPSNI